MKDFSNLTDAELSEAIKSSDPLAFKALYYRYHDAIGIFVYHRIGSVDMTRDFVQEVFTRLWHTRSNIDIHKSIKAYLYRIANNLAIDHYRKNASRKTYLSAMARQKHLASQESIEMSTAVKMAIDKLPDKLRSVFMLSRYEGLKYSEIAEVCKVSVKTIESRMSQALSFLRKEL